MKKAINALSVSLLSISAIGLMPDARSVDLEEGEVYVAGQTFPLEQALNQALEENPPDTKRHFWVVVSGHDAARLARTDASAGLRESLKRIQERGGIIYVCQSDMRAHGITPPNLIPGAAPIHGFGGASAEAPPPPQPDSPLPSDVQHARLILRSCADNDAPENATRAPSAR